MSRKTPSADPIAAAKDEYDIAISAAWARHYRKANRAFIELYVALDAAWRDYSEKISAKVAGQKG